MSKEPVKRDDARRQAQSQSDDERLERERQQRDDPLYLEKTRPEDPSSRQGQLTRDNVNPNIPSGERGDVPNAGGIVDPKSLGMESQEGTPPPKAIERDVAVTTEGEVEGSQYSINEPPGSDVYSHVPGMDNELPPEGGAREAQVKTSRVHSGANADPDDIEDELDQMKEEGDVEMRGKGAPKKK